MLLVLRSGDDKDGDCRYSDSFSSCREATFIITAFVNSRFLSSWRQRRGVSEWRENKDKSLVTLELKRLLRP